MSTKTHIENPNITFFGSIKKQIIDAVVQETRREADRNFFLFSVLMSVGGLTWGILALYFGLTVPSVIPFGYVIFSCFNLTIWVRTDNKRICKALQTFFSILLPFVFQIILGGSKSTGVVMIWSLFALTSTLAFYKGKSLFYWLVIFVVLLGIVILIDHEIEHITPESLRNYQIFNLLLMINFSMISSMLFFLSKFFVDQQLKTMDELVETNGQLIAAEEEVRQNSEEIFVMNDMLKESNQKLEDAYVELEKSKDNQIEQMSHAIFESIDYAKNIQSCFLPQLHRFPDIVKDGFIFFKPRDVVSGDFYWFYKYEQYRVITAVDCTGHGVPGAFMSLLGAEALNSIVVLKQIFESDQILNELDKMIRKKLKQDTTNNKDGMDISLTVFNTETKKVAFSGAKNPLIYIKDNELHVIKGDRQPIGMFHPDQNPTPFTKHEFDYDASMSFYLYSDGFQDQFGGPKMKKFMPKKLKEAIFNQHHLKMSVQLNMLKTIFSTWKKDEQQTDDVLVIGFSMD
ncbi:PP2C family protein-serine/threonine phosphatase [Flammeovirga kamogawensis]|uniref:SpoIIE family protein phosphatase n=1 Tax=Flammeovirga kamogawensis TaxID=373891 RepID=A0ABX8GXG4_9BACT|nr:SpoIIE family protein phosphatase [Flammeovirga kamogawensis]MBB6460731.1 serine phosphatase RsbU (regulator of sigma subunit) [Flammeovirga kamogawensis]QWG08084.1 SpoIIE family protein phosphatase [Flammeovirga kamogawensis]TRX69887.1 SpoIIE family protein phosphatase [Flammeovirga kamogawensis]